MTLGIDARSARIGLMVVIAIAIGAAAFRYREEPAAPLTPISIQFDWKHGADFAGYYAADQNGDYSAQGLDVAFLIGGPALDPVDPVADGRAQFGTATAHHLLRARADGKPIRAIACIFRRSPLVFAGLARSGITHPRDFAGKTVRLSTQNIPVLISMTSRFDIGPDQYTVVQTYDLEELYTGAVDIWGGYITGSVRDAENEGHELNLVYPDNFGVHAYHECLFSTDNWIDAEPDLVARFLRATLTGWRFVLDHPAEVVKMSVRFDPNLDAADQIGHLRAARPLFNTGEDHIGWMKPEIWAGMAETLHDTGSLIEPIDATQVYTLRFLEDIYGASKRP